MKIRSGFVSNSSSSSFILKFDKLPESVEEVKILLYGENPPLLTTYWGDDAVSTQQVAEILFRDIESSGVMDVEDMISVIKDKLHFSQYGGDEGRHFVVGTEYLEEFDKLYKEVVRKDKEFNEQRWNNGTNNPNRDWNKHYEEMDKIAKPLYDMIEKVITEKYSDLAKYIGVEYSDNDGMVLSYMEHSGILDPITVQSFSHH